ncbi:MAG: hypothetical protein GF311_00580 [Candidatus Lokiarchaeota archaeon]|nr:hypothetical protein [Candidatus Lokiarchaeota archaeon]
MNKIKSYTRVSQFLILFGALSGLFYNYMNLYHLKMNEIIQINELGNINRKIIGMTLLGISILLAAKLNHPLPFNSLLILSLGFLMFIFSFFLGGIIIMIAGILNIIDKSQEEEIKDGTI